ncbi:MAG: hypothetical protein ACFCUM_05205 [Bacteroidales bacterium]
MFYILRLRVFSLKGHYHSVINHLLLSSSRFSSLVWGTLLQVRGNGDTMKKGAGKLLNLWLLFLVIATRDTTILVMKNAASR